MMQAFQPLAVGDGRHRSSADAGAPWSLSRRRAAAA